MASLHCCNSQRPSKKTVTMVTLLVAVLIYIGANLVDVDGYTGNKFWRPVTPCFKSKQHTAGLIELAHKTHLVLDSMGVDHWLMYGSLWGPLRGIPGPLPWDHDVDIGIDGNGNFKKIPLKNFKAKFEAAGLGLIDKLQESRYLSVKGYGESVGLFLYYNYRGTMMRSGYQSWIFFIHYRFRHSFPAKLLQHPMPKVKFGSFNISVPRGGIEIMKHLYPTNWWKVVKPKSCKD
ncbi:unnamed protein product [Porites lobata]|uniref:Uncharacterized protein n=1 Tax=Porites lobata TaxID=104759 RepID=A0ABN8PU62_9CNID|nr:unnamed protein product [Porites lobata]